MSRPNGRVARAARRLLDRRYRERAPDGWLMDSALVVAPHPDDETLGCGGTIFLRRSFDATVHVAFLTDGTLSHHGRIAARELAALRRREGVEACARLGVGPDHVCFFGYPDGDLARVEAAAAARLASLIDSTRPAHVLVSSRHDGTPDHVAAAMIARAAIRASSHRAALFEYPVWHWDRWPYSPLPKFHFSKRSVRDVSGFLWRSVAAWWLPMRLSGAFSVDVSAVLATKSRALDAHQTQVRRPAADPDWPVLGEVGRGAFLENLMGGAERFWPVRAGNARQVLSAESANYDGALERK